MPKLNLSGSGKLKLGLSIFDPESGHGKCHPNDLQREQFYVTHNTWVRKDYMGKWLLYPTHLFGGRPFGLRKPVEVRRRRGAVEKPIPTLTAMGIAMDKAKKDLLKVYDDFADLPKWAQSKVAVLQLLASELYNGWSHPVEGVGAVKHDRTTYLIVRGEKNGKRKKTLNDG